MSSRTAMAAVRRRMPGPVKAVARGVAGAFDPVRVARYRRAEQIEVPIPSRRLRTRIGCRTPADYVETGQVVAERIAKGTASVDRPIDGFASILDFGCGTGRVLHHLLPRLAPDAQVWGVDVDRSSIAWAQQHNRGVTFAASEYAPPLGFDDASFDLVYAISIFTHLDEAKQDEWLRELARVLRPDGLALLTVLGDALYERVRTRGDVLAVTQPMVDEARRHGPLEDEGLVFLPYVRRGLAAQGSPDIGDSDYGLTFHGDTYLRERWSRHFDVLNRVPRSINVHQDTVLLRPRSAA